MKRTLVVLMTLALGTALFLGAACGGGGPPDAADVYQDAGEKMAALSSYHVAGRGEEAEGTFEVEIDFVPPDKSRISATFTAEEGFTARFGIIQIGDEFYSEGIPFGPPSEDFFVYSEEVFGPPPRFADFLTALWTEITDLTYVGEEEIDGVVTHRLRGTLAPEVLALTEPDQPPTESATVEIWVAKEDSLVRQYREVSTDETITVTLSRFDDETISVTAPANPLPATQIAKAFIESLSAEQQECLRGKWGEAVYEEISGGTRFPTDEEEALAEECGIE